GPVGPGVTRRIARVGRRHAVVTGQEDRQRRGARNAGVGERRAPPGGDVGREVLLRLLEFLDEVRARAEPGVVDVLLVVVDVAGQGLGPIADVADLDRRVLAERALEAGAPRVGVRRLIVRIERGDAGVEDDRLRIGRARRNASERLAGGAWSRRAQPLGL